MPVLHVAVNGKIATYNRRDGEIVCNNSDYSIQFTFSNEWAGVDKKTARFIWNGEYFDQEFTGVTCPVPEIRGTDTVQVGVYTEGDLRTTTDAVIGCQRSILCKSQVPNKNTGKSYTTQAQEAAQEAESAADRAEAAATRAEAASDALNTPGTLYATDDGEGNVTLRGEVTEMADQEARADVAEAKADVAELREKVENLDGSGSSDTPPTSIDLSTLDTEGKIVETYADGSTKTTTMEFDADGNPVKITDGDGNETVLTW